jgi:hypothetical protein
MMKTVSREVSRARRMYRVVISNYQRFSFENR